MSADFSKSAKTVQLISCRPIVSAVQDDKLVIRRSLIKEFMLDVRSEEVLEDVEMRFSCSASLRQ